MHSPLAAVVLCIFAHVAAPQCLAADAKTDMQPSTLKAIEPAPVKATHVTAVKVIKSSVAPSGAVAIADTGAVAAQPHTGGELIKTAAAGTREDAPPAAHASARSGNLEEPPRRGSTAMLLAALALMSAIALRRFGAPGR